MRYHGKICPWPCCKFHWWWQWASPPGGEPRAYRTGVTVFGRSWTWERKAVKQYHSAARNSA